MVGAAVRKLPYCCSVLRQPSSTSVSPCSTWRFSWSRNCRAKQHASGSSVDLQQEEKLGHGGDFPAREIGHGRRAEAGCASALDLSAKHVVAGTQGRTCHSVASIHACTLSPSLCTRLQISQGTARGAACMVMPPVQLPDMLCSCSASAQTLRQGLPSSRGRRWSGRRQRR